MGWMQKCYETYDNNERMVGKYEGKEPLCPIFHTIVKAKIEILLNEDGDFVGASEIDEQTITPATIDSVTRSSNVAPHVLCDKISYVAGDFHKGEGKNKKKFETYKKQLYDWSESKFSNDKVKAVYKYVEKATMMHDLGESHIKVKDEVVRFRVLGDNESTKDIWKDVKLMKQYIEYYLKEKVTELKDICYVSGDKLKIEEKHLSGIVPEYPRAKLLSADDDNPVKFKGRFFNANQACAVSYEVSQKAHLALKWVIANQGVSLGKTKRYFVCWNPKGGKTMNILSNPFLELEDDNEIAYTQPEYQEKVYKTLTGYRNELGDSEDIVIMGLDAATTGRLSITYYNELKASDFYDRIEDWYRSLNWYYYKKDSSKQEIRTPAINEIIDCAFGTIDDNLIKGQMQRLIYCILDKQPIPKDITQALFLKASCPSRIHLEYQEKMIHEKILSTACAVIAKERKVQDMRLNDCKNRSFLFGRLLAVAEKVERDALKKENVTREPNAMRYRAAFVNHPMSVWKNLENTLEPYYERMSEVGLRFYYKNLITSIFVELTKENDIGNLNRPLDEYYLLGYYLQRNDLYTKKQKTSEEGED